jgi:hypothetical protein
MCHRRVNQRAIAPGSPSQPASASAVDRGCKNPPTGTEATRPSPAKHRCPREGHRRRGGDSACGTKSGRRPPDEWRGQNGQSAQRDHSLTEHPHAGRCVLRCRGKPGLSATRAAFHTMAGVAGLGRASAGVKQCPGWSHALRTTSFVGLKDRWLCRPVVGAIRAIDVALLGCLAPHGSGLKLTPGFDLTDLICHGLKPFGATGHGPSPLAGCSRLAKNPGVRQEVAGSAGRGLLIPHTPVGAELPCRP